MNTLDIKLFGAIEICWHGNLLTNFRSQKALVLLAYLICENRPLTREYLAGLGWPDMNAAQALGLLRRSLHVLNQQLPGCLDIDRRTVHFRPTVPVTLDIHRFASYVAQAEVNAWAQAAVLYRASFLQGIYLDDAPELESWLHQEQDRWQQQVVEVLNRLIGHYTAHASYAQALHYTRQWLSIEPWQEAAHYQSMLLLARGGHISTALAQYEHCRQILWAELGVEPALETEALYARIQAMRLIPPANLPVTTTPFIGREEECVQLIHLLAEENCRVVTIVGVGGIGKTRLALEIAHRVVTEPIRIFLHGIVFVPLAGIETLTQLLSALAQACSLRLQEHATSETQLLDYLSTQERLVVLDNFEHLISECSLTFLLKVLDRAPGIKFLITSRVHLQLYGEQRYWLQGLPFSISQATLSVEAAATGYSSHRLFLAAVGRVSPTYRLTATDVPALLAICQQVQGMPLALELAAAWSNVLSLAEIAAEIGRNLDFLAHEAHDLPVRQRSMRAVFATSWRLLNATEQSVLQKVAIFRGGFTREAAHTVAGAALPVLSSLVRKSFLHKCGSERFEIHELLRQFAQEQLVMAGELHAVQRAHTTYFLALAEQAQPHFFSTARQIWIQRLESEHDNLRAALTWALRYQETESLVRLAFALRLLWECRHYYDEMNEWLAQALALAEQQWTDQVANMSHSLDEPLRNRVKLLAQILLARANALKHDRQQSEALYERSLTLAQRIGLTDLTFELYDGMAVIAARQGNLTRANELNRCALQLAQTLSDLPDAEQRRKIGTALAICSAHAFFQADPEQSKTLAQQALSLLDPAKDSFLCINTHGVLGGVAMLTGDFEHAQTLFTYCYTYFCEINDITTSIFYRWHLGILALRCGDWPSAQIVFIENLTWLQSRSKDYDMFVHNLHGLAEVARQQTRYEVAAKLLGAVTVICNTINYVVLPVYRPDFEATIVVTSAQLEPDIFAAAYAEGYAMSLEQAVLFALAS